MRQQQPMDAPVFNENRGEEIFDHKLEDEAEIVLRYVSSPSVEGFLPSRCFHGTDEEPIHPSVGVPSSRLLCYMARCATLELWVAERSIGHGAGACHLES